MVIIAGDDVAAADTTINILGATTRVMDKSRETSDHGAAIPVRKCFVRYAALRIPKTRVSARVAEQPLRPRQMHARNAAMRSQQDLLSATAAGRNNSVDSRKIPPTENVETEYGH